MNAGYAMGGQMEQNAPVQHHVHHSNHAAAAGTDTGDAVMARWLQSAGLQHLAAPLAAAALDHRLLPSLLMQVPSPPILLQLGFRHACIHSLPLHSAFSFTLQGPSSLVCLYSIGMDLKQISLFP
jgi:hypothetical protein